MVPFIPPSVGVEMSNHKPRSELVNTPHQIRNRLRRKGKRFQEDLDMLMEVGYKPLDQWDLEELARGRPRDKNGKWGGRAPAWLKPEVVKEAKRRLMDHTFGSLAGHIDAAVAVIGDLLKDESVDMNGRPIVDSKTKLAAATFVVEHMIGKAKATLEVAADEVTKGAIAAAIVLDDGMPQDVIEGEIVDDDEEEDDDDEE